MFSPITFFLFLGLSFWPFSTPSQDASPILETSLELPRDAESYKWIRVLLIKKTPEAVIKSPQSYRVYDVDGRSLMTGKASENVVIKTSETGLMLGNQNFRTPMLKLVSEGEGFSVGGRFYRHGLIVWQEDGGMVSVINELEVDDYLRGVLPWEANPKWTQESLQAQAIASRTYALFKAIERQDRRYVMTGDIMSQVYKGRDAEKPQTDLAIQATRGQILTYRGRIFPGYFHSTCAGATTKAEYLWNVRSHPSLEGVKCGFCDTSKHYRWRNEISREHIESVLAKRGKPSPGIFSVDPIDIDRTGRARYFHVHYEGGVHEIHSNDFRLWVGPSKLKSTFIQIVTRTDSGFVFEGKGWGHGVGLCQYGMKRLGELGYSARKIVNYYFPGSSIIRYYG